MSQSLNALGKMLMEHCEQDNKAYQSDVVQVEEEGRNIIAKHV